MKTLCKGFLFSACDVTALDREVKHWTNTVEKCNIKVRILQHTALKLEIWVEHMIRVYAILKLIATGTSL